jgi:hypothetical protein
MPRRKASDSAKPQATTSSWQDEFARRIKAGKVVPLLSDSVGNDLVLGGHQALSEKYAADRLAYPLDDADIPQVAQFKCIIDEAMIDTRALKSDFIDFVKNRLFDIAEKDGVDEEVRAEVEEEFDDINFTEFCRRLGYPRFESEQVMPLLVLADLPLPIYVTSSYHGFLQAALRRAGKSPQTEVCRWHEGLSTIPSVFDDGVYAPTKEAPLVFHLHGMDTYPESLVLTVDDHLQFLVAVSRGQGQNTDPIPKRIREAMADSSLLLLGYTLQSWNFRSLFWALIKPRPRQPAGVAIQLRPGEAEKRYLQRYLRTSEFQAYWGNIHKYAQELRQALEE